MKKIVSFLTACKSLFINAKLLPGVNKIRKIHREALVATYKLWIIADAIRGKWRPDYNDQNQRKYFPVFYFEPSRKKGGRPTLVFADVDAGTPLPPLVPAFASRRRNRLNTLEGNLLSFMRKCTGSITVSR